MSPSNSPTTKSPPAKLTKDDIEIASPTAARQPISKASHVLERETHQFLSPVALKKAGQCLRESRSFDFARLRNIPGVNLEDDEDDEAISSPGWPYDMSPVPVISIKPEDYVTSSGAGVLNVQGIVNLRADRNEDQGRQSSLCQFDPYCVSLKDGGCHAKFHRTVGEKCNLHSSI